MEKNVGSVDIEELKRAREELNQMRGIENDPNMYSNYNPERNKQSVESEESQVEIEEIQNDLSGNSFASDIDNISFNEQESEPDEVSKDESDDFSEVYESSSENSEENSSELLDEFLNEYSSEKSEDSNSDITSEIQPREILNKNEEKSDAQEIDKKKVKSSEPSEKDFSVYDNFSAFEINDGNTTQSEPIKEIPNDETLVSDVENDKAGEEAKEQIAEDKDASVPRDYLIEITPSEEINNQEIKDETVNDSNDNQEQNEDIAENNISSILNEDSEYSLDSELETENEEKISENNQVDDEELVKIDNDFSEQKNENIEQSDVIENDENLETLEKQEIDQTSSNDDLSEILSAGGLGELLSEKESVSSEDKNNIDLTENEKEEDKSESKPLETEEKQDDDTIDNENSKGLKERIEELKENNEVETGLVQDIEDEEAEIEDKNDYLPEIEPFDYADVISTNEFMDNGKLTIFIGRDEEKNNIYFNLKDSLNIGIFGKQSSSLNTMLDAIILSLMLKNSSNELNYVICDTTRETTLEKFENSEYMFFNRISRTQKEIFDALSSLSEEIEERYDNLGIIGAKSIDGYNEQVNSENKMPYIVLFYNNYSNVASNDYFEEINALLYNILKIGRLVGIYVILTSKDSIENIHVGYNLPTRISFKVETKNESISRLGISGAESLFQNDEFLWVNIVDERCIHAKLAKLTSAESKIIIENIENN